MQAAKTLRTATLSLIYPTTEYCVHQAREQTKYLPVLTGIQPGELRRQGATLYIAI